MQLYVVTVIFKYAYCWMNDWVNDGIERCWVVALLRAQFCVCICLANSSKKWIPLRAIDVNYTVCSASSFLMCNFYWYFSFNRYTHNTKFHLLLFIKPYVNVRFNSILLRTYTIHLFFNFISFLFLWFAYLEIKLMFCVL